MGTAAFGCPAKRSARRDPNHTPTHAQRATLHPAMKPARLLVFQAPRNPTERDREILTLLAEGHTHKQAAGHLGLKAGGRVARPSYVLFSFPFRNCGCPALAIFARAGTMLLVAWACHAQRPASYVRRSSPALYHCLVLSAIAFAELRAGAGPVSFDS